MEEVCAPACCQRKSALFAGGRPHGGVGAGGVGADFGDVGGVSAAGAFDGEVEGGELEELDVVELEVGKGEHDAFFVDWCRCLICWGKRVFVVVVV